MKSAVCVWRNRLVIRVKMNNDRSRVVSGPADLDIYLKFRINPWRFSFSNCCYAGIERHIIVLNENGIMQLLAIIKVPESMIE